MSTPYPVSSISGGVTLYQVSPPSFVRAISASVTAQPSSSFIISIRIKEGDSTRAASISAGEGVSG